LQQVLDPEVIEDHCRALGHHWRQGFWSPAATVLAFLLQVLSSAKSLRSAVARWLTHQAAAGVGRLPSPDPSAYCQARARLPSALLPRMLQQVAQRVQSLKSSALRWRGHRVWVVDGSTVNAPDTPALQQAFPQAKTQAPGCGFPLARLVAVFCWATGAVVEVAIDSWRRHEVTLWRGLWDHLRTGDVVLADRAYGSYTDMARLRQRGVHSLFRLHQRRRGDLRHGRRLGKGDRRVRWDRPVRWLPSFGLSREAFEQLPASLTVRQVGVTHTPKGFRPRRLVLATTLTDPKAYPAEALRALYRDRWTVELRLRELKTHMGMERLRGKSPDVVRKEILMHLLAYNLVRLVMWEAARAAGKPLHRLSFTGTLHRLQEAWPRMLLGAAAPGAALLGWLLRWIAQDVVPWRPDRFEPRRVKRRPIQYSRLVKPRRWYHQHGDKLAP
jgi:hypothetical protein